MKTLRLHHKVQLLLVILSLIPLVILAINSIYTLRKSEIFLLKQSTQTIDKLVANNLQLRATMVAHEVSDFLNSVVDDLHDLSSIPPVAQNYLKFYRSHQRKVLENGAQRVLPLYSELAFINGSGREQIHIVNGKSVDNLRDVSLPINTTYKTEDYFGQTLKLAGSQVYISHLNGWHISKNEQLLKNKGYVGVIRFATKIYDAQGNLAGVVVLSLDHSHLMEFIRHVAPSAVNSDDISAYESGNYAFMFDDQGWMIAHPKLWDIRGLDNSGNLMPAYSSQSTPQQIASGQIPFNLNQAGFVHSNYPLVSRMVHALRSGIVNVTNVGGAHKIMAYAPIIFKRGPYKQVGLFGGVTIGANLNDFHRPAIVQSKTIRSRFTEYITITWLIIALTAILVLIAAWVLSINMTQPILQLTAGTKKMAAGEHDVHILTRSNDEIGELAQSFNIMVDRLKKRSDKLIRTLEDLRRSRQEILRERNINKTIVESIAIGVLSIDDGNNVLRTSSAARNILHIGATHSHNTLDKVLSDWPEIYTPLEAAIQEQKSGQKRWHHYLETWRNGKPLTIRIALFAQQRGSKREHIITIEDISERIALRNQVERMERLATLGKFSAGIAHEVRNPLTGISLLLDELHDRLLSSPADQALIRKALDEIERLELLVDDLLHYTTSCVHRRQLGSILDVVTESLATISRQCKQADIEVDFVCNEQIPDIRMDVDKIKQALLNLYQNAINAMPNGGKLTVTLSIQEEMLLLTVADNGIGISSERLELIFEPFHTNRRHGTGLGLSITHNIISEHEGTITVKSVLGQGTSFHIRLPLI